MAIYEKALQDILANNQQNPYLKQQGDYITQQVNDNLQRNVMPGIGAGAQSAGQYGGSRQGIAQGLAAGEASKNIAGQLANMYGQDYGQGRALQGQVATQLSGQDAQSAMQQNQISAQAAMQANQLASQKELAQMSDRTQNRGLENQYNLGLGGLGLQSQGQQNNFYTANRGQDLQQYQLGANMYGQGAQGNLGIGQSQYNLGNQAQQNQYNALNQYSGGLSPYTGLNSSTTQTGGNQGSNTWGNVLGGLSTGLGLWNAWKG
jgi:hypothetical protein